ncbi:MAG: type II toxin-antitoxin system VapC family toxin [Mycobacteriaceae bacterium]
MAVVAQLLEAGPDGQWVTEMLSGASLIAPSLIMFEAGNIIRRHAMSGLVSADQAAQAHGDLLDLSIEQWRYELLGSRGLGVAHEPHELRRQLRRCRRTGGRAAVHAGPTHPSRTKPQMHRHRSVTSQPSGAEANAQSWCERAFDSSASLCR